MKTKKNQKSKPLSAGQERLLDLFAAIERWSTRPENKAFVFLSDGKESLIFANRLEDLSCEMPQTLSHDPKMAAFFSILSQDAECLFDLMQQDIPDWKKDFDKVQTSNSLPSYFFYGLEIQ